MAEQVNVFNDKSTNTNSPKQTWLEILQIRVLRVW